MTARKKYLRWARVVLVSLLVITLAPLVAASQQMPVPAPHFLFPPVCVDNAVQNTRVCMSWDAYNHDFVEIWRGPIPSGGILRLRDLENSE